MPEFWLTRRYPTGLEQLFTVVWWEQRGAGLSYSASLPASSMTVSQFIEDTLVVTDYLRERFAMDKIYVLAHSWGSFIGLQAVARAPEKFHAYVGMGQVTHQLESERLAYEYIVDRCRVNGDRRMLRRLTARPVTLTQPLPRSYLALRDVAMHRLGVGTTRDMRSVVSGIFVPTLRSPDYTLRERVRLWRGRAFSRGFGLWDEMLRTDLRTKVTELEVPAYFLHGRHDRTASYSLAEAFASKLRAPLVGFYTFSESAHSPAFEEPRRSVTVFREDILTGSAEHSDGKP